nr:glycoside hydrolase [Opitutaceae bacterium]
GLRPGDLAGLALLNCPYATLGVARVSPDGAPPAYVLRLFDQRTGVTIETPLPGPRVWLRAHCDFLAETATFAWSTDGLSFAPIGDTILLIFQLRTFQGVRYSLFNYHVGAGPAGHADFSTFTVHEPHPRGLFRPIPLGRSIRLTVRGRDTTLPLPGAESLRVLDLGQGRVALAAADGRLVSVASPASVDLRSGPPTASESWQWTETVYGDLILLSVATHRHLRVHPETGALSADHPGPLPNRADGSCFDWTLSES